MRRVHERTLMFKYTTTRRRGAWRGFLEEIASSHGASLVRSRRRMLQGQSAAALERMALIFWNRKRLTELRQKGTAILSREKLKELQRPVAVEEQVFVRRGPPVFKLITQLADRNELKCCGAWTWMERDLFSQGCSVIVQTDDKARLASIAAEIIKFAEPQPEQTITRCWACGRRWSRSARAGSTGKRVCECGNME